MKKISIRKTFICVCVFLLTLCALCAFAIWERPAKTVSAEAATSFTQLGSYTDWGYNGSGSVVSDANGHGFNGSGEYKLKSTRKLWMDRFGLSFRTQKSSGTMRIVLTPDEDVWYQDSGASQSAVILELRYTGSSSADVAVYIGSKNVANDVGVALVGGRYVIWGNSNSNTLYLGKTSTTQWALTVNGTTHSFTSDECAKLETAFTDFTDKVGFLQVHNVSGNLLFNYKSILFGLPKVGGAAEGFSTLILDEPDWKQTIGDEVASWSPSLNSQYTVVCDKILPFKGMEIDLRMAPAEERTSNLIAFTSLYEHNWYAGTYSIVFGFRYDPAVHGDDRVDLEFHYSDNTTDSSGVSSMKMTLNLPFNWYGTNNFRFYKELGVWHVQLNGENVFEGMVDEMTGLTASDYLDLVYNMCDDNKCYFQMYGCGDATYSTPKDDDVKPVPYDGLVIEYMKAWTQPEGSTANIEIKDNKTNFLELETFEFKTNLQIRIAMQDLFTVTGSASVDYWATLGTMQSNDVWAYTARGVGEQWVTFKCISDGAMNTCRVKLTFVKGPDVVAPEAAALVTFGESGIGLTMIGENASTTLSAWQVALIAVGSVALVGAIATTAFVLTKKRRGE